MATVGILALQGDFAEHASVLRRLSVPHCQVRTATQLAATGALIIPGGESTTIAKLIDIYALRDPLLAYARSGKPIWGTCAGLILLAKRLLDDRPQPLGLMDIVVRRNAFGRQADSFETYLNIAGLPGGSFHAVFIRAPVICGSGPDVEPLATLADGSIVAVRQGNLLATAFHPELTTDTRMHALFLEMTAAPATR